MPVRKKTFGFSLIEISLALVVISSLAVVMISRISTGKDLENQQKAIRDLNNIKTAIQEYVLKNGYYPCPAKPAVADIDPNYASGTRFANGYCDLTGVDQMPTGGNSGVDYSDVTHYNSSTSPIAVKGAVPCLDIGLSKDCGIDPYGNKYAYAIPPTLAISGNVDPLSYAPSTGSDDSIAPACRYADNGGGDIGDIKEDQNTGDDADTPMTVFRGVVLSGSTVNITASLALTAPQNPVTPDFVVIYYGKDGMGAYTKSGTQIDSEIVNSVRIENNVYQEINNDLQTLENTTYIDQYFYMPLSPPDAGVAKNKFDDILVWGTDAVLNTKFCGNCSFCNGAPIPGTNGDNRVFSVPCTADGPTDDPDTDICNSAADFCDALDVSNLCD